MYRVYVLMTLKLELKQSRDHARAIPVRQGEVRKRTRLPFAWKAMTKQKLGQQSKNGLVIRKVRITGRRQSKLQIRKVRTYFDPGG